MCLYFKTAVSSTSRKTKRACTKCLFSLFFFGTRFSNVAFFSVASYIINTEVSCKNGKRDKSPWRQITLDRRVMSRYTFLFMLCDYRCYPSITTLCVKYRSPQEKKDQQ